jgi:hypothetical protein
MRCERDSREESPEGSKNDERIQIDTKKKHSDVKKEENRASPSCARLQ